MPTFPITYLPPQLPHALRHFPPAVAEYLFIQQWSVDHGNIVSGNSLQRICAIPLRQPFGVPTAFPFTFYLMTCAVLISLVDGENAPVSNLNVPWSHATVPILNLRYFL